MCMINYIILANKNNNAIRKKSIYVGNLWGAYVCWSTKCVNCESELRWERCCILAVLVMMWFVQKRSIALAIYFSCTSSYTALWLICVFFISSPMSLTEAYAMLFEQDTVPCSKLVSVFSTVSYATLSVQENSLVVFIPGACIEKNFAQRKVNTRSLCLPDYVRVLSSYQKLTIHPVYANAVKIAMS